MINVGTLISDNRSRYSTSFKLPSTTNSPSDPHISRYTSHAVPVFRAQRVIVRIGPVLIQVREIPLPPSQFRVFLGIPAVLPDFALSEQARSLQSGYAFSILRIHSRFYPSQGFIQFLRARKRAPENQVRQILLVFQRISLYERPAERMPQ